MKSDDHEPKPYVPSPDDVAHLAQAPIDWAHMCSKVIVADGYSNTHKTEVQTHSLLFERAQRLQTALLERDIEGVLTPDAYEALVSGITDKAGRLGYELTNSSGGMDAFYYWPDSVFQLDIDSSGRSKFTVSSINPARFREVVALAEGLITDREKEIIDNVYILIQGSHGYRTHALPSIGLEVERGNYDDDALQKFDYAVQELSSSTPTGRFVLLHGAPGSGKTYLVRALVHAVPAAQFVYIPAALVEQLSGPHFMPTLLELHEDNPGPIVVILEDADSCLIPRGSDNISAISNLLNLTSGILGDALDMRVIATTNARKVDIDPALLREMRLITRMEVDDLSVAHATKIVSRLTGKIFDFLPADAPPLKTLAACYKYARANGWTPPPVKAAEKRNIFKLVKAPGHVSTDRIFEALLSGDT